MMHPKTAARHGAIKALVGMEQEDKLLTAALDELALPPQARPFAREITTGAVRHRTRLDYTLEPLLHKPLSRLDAPVRAALRLAAYERLVAGTPPAAVANEYAAAMRDARLSSAVAFVNAVARRLPHTWRPSPDVAIDPARHLAIEYSHPAWLVERWLNRFGTAECSAVCAANNRIAPLSLRVNTRRASRDEVLERLRARGLAANAGHFSPDAVIVAAGGSPLDWAEWRDGLVMAQDEAAQLVGHWAASPPGQIVVDAASAPGGKATHLAQLMNDAGRVIACDVAAGRLKLVHENAARLGLHNIETRAGDFRRLTDGLPSADLVLLDAPCLGTGTLRRRPDAKWRKTAAQLKELIVLQCELLDAAAKVVRPGGHLVYSTCSLEPEENEGQARAFLERHSDWRVVSADALRAPGQIASASPVQSKVVTPEVITEEGYLRTSPHRHGCDGMFAVKFQRSA
jgi:16S rRNA (cytosine967-C5)-methyltransferase